MDTMSIPSHSSSGSSDVVKPVISMAIRNTSMGETKNVAKTLLAAFEQDHVMRYFVDTPDAASDSEEKKLRRLRKVLELTTAFHIECGVVTTVGSDYDSVALWLPPCEDTEFRFAFFKAFWKLNFILTREGRRRFFNEFTPLLVTAKNEVLGEHEPNAWYLVYLATKPGSQGRGYGRMLVEQMVTEADKQGQHLYLESSNEANLRFYGKMGFIKAKEVYLERDKERIGLDILVRDPKVTD